MGSLVDTRPSTPPAGWSQIGRCPGHCRGRSRRKGPGAGHGTGWTPDGTERPRRCDSRSAPARPVVLGL